MSKRVELKREFVLLAIVSLLWLWFLSKIISFPMPSNIKITVFPQKHTIKTINSSIDSSLKSTFFIDKIYFPEANELIHYRKGRLGYKSNFFLDIRARFNVLEEGSYIFSVESDDGFKLVIDTVLVCKYDKDRPYRRTLGMVKLSKGIHELKLLYFQAFGPLGLKVSYKKGDSKFYIVGENSKFIKFLKYK